MSNLVSRRSVLGNLGLAFASPLLGGCLETTGTPPYRQVQSYTALKYKVTVRQLFDFSCGGASVATLLTYHMGRPTQEVEVLDKLRSRYPGQNWNALQKVGFSMEDLIWVSKQLGYEAQGARIAGDDLANLSGPVIVHVNNGTFEHFTVLRTRRGGRTFISDPVAGAIVESNEEFDAKYTGAAMAIWKKGQAPPMNTELGRPGPFISADSVQRGVGELTLPNWVKPL